MENWRARREMAASADKKAVAHLGQLRKIGVDPSLQELVSLGEDVCHLRTFSIP